MSKSTAPRVWTVPEGWVERLSLQLSSKAYLHEYAINRVLRRYVPVSFAPIEGGDTIGLEELVCLVEDAKLERERATDEFEAADNADFESAFSYPDSDQEITEGSWAGFTRGEARAWCWNLFQFESPSMPLHRMGPQLKAKAVLRVGALVNDFRFPERAKEYVAQGVTPQAYREQKQAERREQRRGRDLELARRHEQREDRFIGLL